MHDPLQDTVSIDYTGLEPGDKAPDEAAAAQPSRAGVSGANVICLSADPVLIDLTRDSLAGTHRIWRADDAAHAADLMVAAGNAVIIIDSALADQKPKEFVNKVHKQFPDIAIIVAGNRDDEGELAPLISEGIVFRFLHKPASAERIRNFVDATLRRGKYFADPAATALRANGAAGTSGTYPTVEAKKLSMPKVQVDPAVVRRWTRRSLLFIPVAAIAWGIAVWKPWEQIEDFLATFSAPETPVAVTDPGQDPAVQRLLDAAGVALSQGQLVDPEDRNALSLYRAVLVKDPDNEMARRGISLVADELLVRAEHALMTKDVPALASAVDAARSARPDHPRLAFFVQQLDIERERVLHPSAPTRNVNASVGRALDAASQKSTAGRVQGLVQLANDRMRSNRLTGGSDSAQSYLLAARKLDPADPGVQQGIASLSRRLQTGAQRALNEGRLDEAGNLLRSAITLNVDSEAIAVLRADLEAARVGNVRQDRARLLVLANQRIAQGRLVEPTGDSARHYLDLLRASDPTFDGLPETSALFAGTALAEARVMIAAGNIDRADSLLRAASDAGANSADLQAAASEITALKVAKAAPPPPSVVAENTMRRTRFASPVYPTRALERGTEGWVDVEFTVASDGTTRDAVVRSADPSGVFDRAALDAVGRWRYEPRMVNGSVVDQRVRARLRFQLEK